MKRTFLPCFFLFFTCFVPLQAQVWNSHVTNYGTPLFGWDIDAVNGQVAWATGISGNFAVSPWLFDFSGHSVARTTDGGQTWRISEFPSTGAGYTSNLVALDSSVAVLSYVDFGAGNQCFKTVDGGLTWQALPLPIDVWINFAHLFDGTNGLAMGDPDSLGFQIFATINGGNGWIRINDVPAPEPGEFGLSDIYCTRSNHVWFATANYRIYHSANKGYTWETFALDPAIAAGRSFDAVAFRDADTGIVALNDYSDTATFIHHTRLLQTGNGGANWQDVTPENDAYAVQSLHYIPGTSTLVGVFRQNNTNGPFETRVSYDDGTTWLTIDTGTPVFKIDFVDQNTGWASEYKNDDQPSRTFSYAGNPLLGLFQPEISSAELVVAPNPVHDFVWIDFSDRNASDAVLMLYDVTGQLLYSEPIPETAKFSKTISLQNRVAGTYHVVVSTRYGHVVQPVIKI